MFEAPPLTRNGPPPRPLGMCDFLSSDASRRLRVLLPERTWRCDPGGGAGMAGKEGPNVWEGGQAGDLPCLLSPRPSHHEPAATPAVAWAARHLAVPASARPGLRRPCAQARSAGVPPEGARGGPGTGGRHAGGGIGGRALGCPSAPCPPTRSFRLRAGAAGAPLRALSPRHTAPTCRARGAPPPRTPILSPSETSRLATRVSDRRRWDPETGRQARSW